MAVDSTTQAELEAPVLRWRMLAYLDFSGDVLRATTNVYEKTISGSGDSELDGTYFSLPSELVDVSTVRHSETGAETVTVSLSGLIGPNSDLLNTIGDAPNWQGRVARLWFFLTDEDENQVGEIIPYYTGYMDAVTIGGSPSTQKITVQIENYLATISGAANKTYLIQSLYDAGDTSAAATIAAANGLVDGVISGSANARGGSGGGGARNANPNAPRPNAW